MKNIYGRYQSGVKSLYGSGGKLISDVFGLGGKTQDSKMYGYGVLAEAISSLIFSRTLTSDLTSGVGVATETFTRASSQNYFPADGGYLKQVAANVPAFGVNGLQIEEQRTNSLLYNRDITNAAWTKGLLTTTKDQVGIDGVANSACLLDESSGSNIGYFFQLIAISDDNATHNLSMFVKKDTNETRFPKIDVQCIDGTTPVYGQLWLNTKTGATSVVNLSSYSVNLVTVSGVEWWKVSLSVTNNSTGNVICRARCYPALGTTIGVIDVAAVGSIIVDYAQLELNAKYPSSPIETQGAVVTRALCSPNIYVTEVLPITKIVYKIKFTLPKSWVYESNGFIAEFKAGSSTYTRIQITSTGVSFNPRNTLTNLTYNIPVTLLGGVEYTLRMRFDDVAGFMCSVEGEPSKFGATDKELLDGTNLQFYMARRNGSARYPIIAFKDFEVHQGSFNEAEVLAL